MIRRAESPSRSRFFGSTRQQAKTRMQMRRRESTRRQLGIGGEKDYATVDESQNEAPEHMSQPRRFPGRTRPRQLSWGEKGSRRMWGTGRLRLRWKSEDCLSPDVPKADRGFTRREISSDSSSAEIPDAGRTRREPRKERVENIVSSAIRPSQVVFLPFEKRRDCLLR